MFQAFYTGISGVQTHQAGMDVISDNLANVNTVGFKASTAEFADLFANTLASAGGSTPTKNDIGLGSRLQGTSTQMQIGSMLNTDRFNDLAIGGNGWFGASSKGDMYYTRAGNFVFDQYQQVAGDANSSIARLTTPDGKYVTGTMLTNFAYNPSFDYGDLTLNGTGGAYVLNNPTYDVPLADVKAQGALEFPTRIAYPAEATTEVQFFGNLGIANEPRTISADVISADNARNRLKLAFTLSPTQPATGIAWDVTATITSNDGTTIYDTKTGQAVFGVSGLISSFSIGSMNNNGTAVSLNLGSNYGGVTAIDGIPISGSSQSNGYPGGALTQYGIDSNGVIIADFTNGRQSAIGRVAVYHFQNDQGLDRVGDTLFKESGNSGTPRFWTDASGNLLAGTSIYSNHLESSNVRLDVGLTDMIVTQRAYQANAKCITTADEMIQKALQMRR